MADNGVKVPVINAVAHREAPRRQASGGVGAKEAWSIFLSSRIGVWAVLMNAAIRFMSITRRTCNSSLNGISCSSSARSHVILDSVYSLYVEADLIFVRCKVFLVLVNCLKSKSSMESLNILN